MKSILDANTRDELIGRINTVSINSQAQWGKMNAYQMLKHCTLWEDMIFSKAPIKQVFMGKIFGKIALRNLLKEGRQIGKNMSTTPELVVKERNGNIGLQKQDWINRIGQYVTFSPVNYIHPFFGSMSKEQIGILAYKHADHHLRQFGA